MKTPKFIYLVLIAFCLSATYSCSSDAENDIQDLIDSEENTDDPVEDTDNSDGGSGDAGDGNNDGADSNGDADNTGDNGGDGDTGGDGDNGDANNGDGDSDGADSGMDGDQTASNLASRFSFVGNLVIENSWNTGGCDSPPCDTNDESLDNFFDTGEPNDPYFYLTEDESELFLECQLERGRRIEFKQRSEGPLTSPSVMEFEGVYHSIPDGGMTIAQVHNRGGSGNKPFFRLELHEDRLETVIRRDPEVSSGDTTFDKVDHYFPNNEDYDESPLTVVLEKGNGEMTIHVTYNGTVILNESYQPDPETRWVTNTGIANGFYLKAGLYNAAVSHTENLVLSYTTFKFSTDDE